MSDNKFANLLKNSLEQLEQDFDAAETDLFEIIGDLNSGISEYSRETVKIMLQQTSETQYGMGYRLIISDGIVEEGLDFLFVSGIGYPIRVAESDCRPFNWSENGIALESREELESYFESIVGNPDSPLSTILAYLVRKNKKS